MCYSTTLDMELKDLERAMDRRMLAGSRTRQMHIDDDRSILFKRVSAFSRPFWPVVSNDRPDVIQMFRWGFFKKDIAAEDEATEWIKRWPSFNAISEEVEGKATYKEAWAKGQRCIIPVTTFTEWMHVPVEGKKTPLKVPYNIRINEPITLLGGLWQDTLLGYRIYTVLTTQSNALMTTIHNSKKRQPVIIPADMVQFWFSPTLPLDRIKQLCDPVHERDMLAQEVQAA